MDFQSFVVAGWGESGWQAVVDLCGLDQVARLSSCPYPDDNMYRILEAASEVLHEPNQAILERYGRFFLKQLIAQGYGSMLKCLGSTLPDFLGSLNDMHLHFSLSYGRMNAPVFRCEDVTLTALNLHYIAPRPGMWPIVVGMIKQLAADLFHHSIDIELIEESQTFLDGSLPEIEHILHVTYPAVLGRLDSSSESLPMDAEVKAAGHYQVPPETLDQLCPFHVLIGANCEVIQYGRSLVNLVPSIRLGSLFWSLFKIKSPMVQEIQSWPDLESLCGQSIVLTMDDSGCDLKGQFVLTSIPRSNGCPVPKKALLFAGTPRITSFNELQNFHLTLADLPLHDLTRDYLLLAEQRKVEADLVLRFEQASMQLKMANSKLAETMAHLEDKNRLLEEERERLQTITIRQYELLECFTEKKKKTATTTQGGGGGSQQQQSLEDKIKAAQEQLVASGAAQMAEQEKITLFSILGQGSFGTVFMGEWRGTRVAVKRIVLPADMSMSSRAEKMAVMEVAISSSLSHPHLVQTYTYRIRPIEETAGDNNNNGLIIIGSVNRGVDSLVDPPSPPPPSSPLGLGQQQRKRKRRRRRAQRGGRERVLFVSNRDCLRAPVDS